MIDFIKLDISEVGADALRQHEQLRFESTVCHESGELMLPDVARYKGLKFWIGRHRIYVSGSLHKYRNQIMEGTDQNFNDFTMSDIQVVLDDLSARFNIPLDSPIIQLEFGVNLSTPFNPTKMLEKNLMSYNGFEATIRNRFRGRGCFYEFERSQHYLKIYDKGRQYHRNENILRCEIKVVCSQYLRKRGISTLNLLLKPEIWIQLGNELITRLESCIIIDEYTGEDKDFLNFTNPKFWTQRREKGRHAFHYSKEKLRSKATLHNRLQTKEIILDLVKTKILELTYDEINVL